jgi:predicted DNA-binding protein (MmcQ/YjbR family)
MMTHKELEEYLLSMPGAWLDYPFGNGTSDKIAENNTSDLNTENAA